ncbi:hypothetical protein NM208_g9624 [Fusarium decemcellulare]|uniref:Uncharacterized protein n=1 Tax=Fusarium decemcellulare TaxID=57161 RepID=A0ACC1S117_9HYPO|nr:hypothetical protein NM208_g9624 [Fusarium decemcellulare]
MAAAYTSYARSVVSWVSELQDDFSSVIDACKDVPEVQSELSSLEVPTTGFCESYIWADAPATSTATVKATDSTTIGSATGSVTDTASGTSTPDSVADSAGARKAGQGIAAVVAVACFAVAGVY